MLDKRIRYITLLLALIFSCSKKSNINYIVNEDQKYILLHAKQSAQKIRNYIEENPEYNSKIIFLIDMSVFSGHYRFFVFDLPNDSIINKGLVAHGKGSDTQYPTPLNFSNIEGSNCTSLGIYKIAESYVGDYGKAYKLYGLSTTNSNAYERSIVLHKYQSVPNNEQEKPICLSLGCPMVSYSFFEYLEFIIDNSSKNILLYIYTS